MPNNFDAGPPFATGRAAFLAWANEVAREVAARFPGTADPDFAPFVIPNALTDSGRVQLPQEGGSPLYVIDGASYATFAEAEGPLRRACKEQEARDDALRAARGDSPN